MLCQVEKNYAYNYREKIDFPIQKKFLAPQIVHEAEISNSIDEEFKSYYGLLKQDLKKGIETIKHHSTTEIVWKTLGYQNEYGHWKIKPKHHALNGDLLKRLIAELNQNTVSYVFLIRSLGYSKIFKRNPSLWVNVDIAINIWLRTLLKMIAWVDAVLCMFLNCIINFLFSVNKLEHCIPEDCLNTYTDEGIQLQNIFVWKNTCDSWRSQRSHTLNLFFYVYIFLHIDSSIYIYIYIFTDIFKSNKQNTNNTNFLNQNPYNNKTLQ